ncbi:L,D-transpeptidase family protein [bacterium]
MKNLKKFFILIILLTISTNSFAKDLLISINIKLQKLYVKSNSKILKTYPISSSRYGTGSESGSNKTPLGMHKIFRKIGNNAPIGTIFKARKNTNKIAKIYTDAVDIEEDFVTTRILWLTGAEKGKNTNSKSRFIYIHGTPEEGLIGKPASHGCIRMKNKDVIELFKIVDNNTSVYIF